MLMTLEDVVPRSPIELTRDEMLTISAEISLKFSPDKTSLAAVDYWPPANVNIPPPAAALAEPPQIGGFSQRELQTIGLDISRRFAPKAANSVPELLLLPVDPHHLYAYWNTGAAPLAPDQKNVQPPLTLRIYWRPDAAAEITRSNIWFDIPADSPTNRKKVRLPIDDTSYSAALGKVNPDHSLDVLAHSNRVHVPTAPDRKRLALEHPAMQSAAAKGPALAVHQLQDILAAAQQEGAYFPEAWSIKLHPSDPATLARESAKFYGELMSIFQNNRIDAELVPEAAALVEQNTLSRHASGLGL